MRSGIPAGTVKSRTHAAMQRLRAAYDAEATTMTDPLDDDLREVIATTGTRPARATWSRSARTVAALPPRRQARRAYSRPPPASSSCSRSAASLLTRLPLGSVRRGTGAPNLGGIRRRPAARRVARRAADAGRDLRDGAPGADYRLHLPAAYELKGLTADPKRRRS